MEDKIKKLELEGEYYVVKCKTYRQSVASLAITGVQDLRWQCQKLGRTLSDFEYANEEL